MRNLLLISFIAFSQFTWTQTKLQLCLAKEEEVYHKAKKTGPEYELNIELGHLINSSKRINLTPDDLSYICSTPKDTALRFMRSVLTSKKYQLGSVDTARELMMIFFGYTASLEARSPNGPCLAKKIPELTKLQERFQILEGDVALKTLMSPTQIKRIFDKLEKVDQLYESCKSRN